MGKRKWKQEPNWREKQEHQEREWYLPLFHFQSSIPKRNPLSIEIPSELSAKQHVTSTVSHVWRVVSNITATLEPKLLHVFWRIIFSNSVKQHIVLYIKVNKLKHQKFDFLPKLSLELLPDVFFPSQIHRNWKHTVQNQHQTISCKNLVQPSFPCHRFHAVRHTGLELRVSLEPQYVRLWYTSKPW